MSDKPTHIVKHPKLHLAVGGKLQHVPAGTPVTLSEKVATGLGKKVQSVKEVEALKVGEDDDAKAKAEADAKAIADAEAQLAAANKPAKK